MKILTISCWTDSLQFRLFRHHDFALLAQGGIERIGIGDSLLVLLLPGQAEQRFPLDYCDHQTALARILATLTSSVAPLLNSTREIVAVGHRVAHGGESFQQSTVIDDQLLETMQELAHLAPLHTAANLAGIRAIQELLPGIPQLAVFDTAFHQTMPEHAYTYPLPHEWYEKYAVRRYGFHGPSHLYLLHRAAALLGKPPAACNLVTVYRDRGVSLCAIKNGVSIDTSMGMTPLEGAVMDHRCGDIDAGIISFEMQRGDLSTREMDIILNQKSGICGIAGQHYEREAIVQAALLGNSRCRLAIEVEAYRLRKYLGAYCAAAGPLDAVVFSRGPGTRDWLVRQLALAGMDAFGLVLNQQENKACAASAGEAVISAAESAIKIMVIPSNEPLVFAEDVAAALNGGETQHPREYTFSRPEFTVG